MVRHQSAVDLQSKGSREDFGHQNARNKGDSITLAVKQSVHGACLENCATVVVMYLCRRCVWLAQLASDGLKGRVFEVSLADLQGDEDQAFRKIKLRAEDVQGKNVLTNFWVRFYAIFLNWWHFSCESQGLPLIHRSVQGMDFTTDKLRSLVRKWQSLIEAHVDVKTTDNYTLRMFCIGFTKKRPNQIKKTCYAQTSQIRQVGI